MKSAKPGARLALGLCALALVALGAALAPKAHLSPLGLTTNVWSGEIVYQVRSAGKVAYIEGALTCRLAASDVGPYWVGVFAPANEVSAAPDVRANVEYMCEALPVWLSDGLPPRSWVASLNGEGNIHPVTLDGPAFWGRVL